MGYDMIDLETLIEARNCLSHIAKLDFSLYDGRGTLLAPSKETDEIVEAFASSREARVEQDRFLRDGVRKAAQRRKPSVFRGPMNQYQFFIPLRAGARTIVLVGHGLYASIKDLDEFFLKKSSSYGICVDEIVALMEKIMPADIGQVSGICGNVQRLFKAILRDNYEKNTATEQFRRTITVMKVLSEIDRDSTEERLYQLLTDAILVLFGSDAVCVAVPSQERFIPIVVAGRFRNQIASVSLKADDPIISDAVEDHSPCRCGDAVKLLRCGYPHEITSVDVFPLALREKTFGLLSVFNAQMTEEEIAVITRLCGFAALLRRTIVTQKTLGAHVDGLTAMSCVSDLRAGLQDVDTLCQSIVEISSKMVSAERVSLMLPEGAGKELQIKAVKGINESIAKHVRVPSGTGIAGRVFTEGKPLIVSDMEKNLKLRKRPGYRTGAFASIPLKVDDESIGVLNLADRAERSTFSQADMVFLNYFAPYASLAIRGAQYFQKSEEMRTLSITDSLTGLFNRRYFDERLFEELQRAVRHGLQFSVATMDIDDFKLFNDTEGHLAGDDALKMIADIARESLRSIDIIARHGGEEFSFIMPQTNGEEALHVAERVRKNIRELVPVTWKNFPRDRITVSIGLAAFPDDIGDARVLMEKVDKALYRAKLQGKDRTVLWATPPPA